MPGWRDLDERLDKIVVDTFDYGDIAFQKMDGDDPDGAPVPLPAEFESAYVSLDVEDGNEVSTTSPAVTIHLADLPDGVEPATGDRIVIGSGRAAGTYEIDDVQVNEGRTGAVLKLKKF